MTSKIQNEKRGRAANLTNAGKGRPKGSKNKNTKALKDMILASLDKVGGVDYLQKQANENPTAYLSLVGKVLPMTVAGTGDQGQHVTEVIVKIFDGNAGN